MTKSKARKQRTHQKKEPGEQPPAASKARHKQKPESNASPELLRNEAGVSPNWKAFLEIQAKRKQEQSQTKCSSGNQVKLITNGGNKRKHLSTHKKQKPSYSKRKKINIQENTQSHACDKIWFDDVEPEVLQKTLGIQAVGLIQSEKENPVKNTEETSQVHDKQHNDSKKLKQQFMKKANDAGPTKYVAIDCEMVGVGKDGKDSILARVSIVNSHGIVILDKYVKPTETVTDYRTAVSGIRKEDIENGYDFKTVQKEVFDIIKNRIVVGHAVYHDMKVLMLSHPKKKIRDTSQYKPLQETAKTRRPSLKILCEMVLGIDIQMGEHSSVEDARAAMELYQLHKKQWEKFVRNGQLHGAKNTESSDVKSVPFGEQIIKEKKSGKQRWLERRQERRDRFKKKSKKKKQ